MKKITFNKNLALLLGGQFISQIGDRFYALALAFWVLRETGSPAGVGLTLFASMAPSVVLGFFAGGVIDRFDRKKILVAADVFRGAVVAAVVAAFYAGKLSMALIVAVEALLSAASAFFSPAVLAAMPQIVPDEGLSKANGASQFLSGAANILGPALGGLAVSFLGYAFVFAFNAVSFLFSALLAGLMRMPAKAAATDKKASVRGNLAAGYAYILKSKGIFVILGVVAAVHFFVGSTQVVMPVLANALAGDGARNLGWIEAAFGVGILAAALTLRAVNLRNREEYGMFGGIAGMGAVLAATGLLALLGISSVLPYTAAFLLLSACVIFIATNYTVILQRTVDNSVAGTVFGITGSVGNFSLPVSVLLFGWILGWVSIGIVLAVCGTSILALCAVLAILYGKYGKGRVRSPVLSEDINPN